MSKNNNDKQQDKTSSEEDKNKSVSEEAKTETPVIAVEEKTTEEKLAEMNDKYVRLYADFENFRKRASKEKVDLFKFASEEILKQLLPVMDDFERAIKASAQATDVETIKQGEQLIYNKFKNMLIQSGVQEMNSTGQAFDPELHDAITNVPAPSKELKGKVIEEVEKGYYLNGKVIRHAKVVVGN